MNHKKRIAIYLLLLFGLFLLTMAVPRVLHTVTGKIVQKAAKQLERDTEQSLYRVQETKMQTERIERNLPDETEPEGQTDPEETQPATAAGSEPSQKQAEEMQTQLEAARRNFHPAYTETAQGGMQELIGTRREAFSDAVSDYLYMLYGGLIEVQQIDVVEKVSEDEAELTYQIEIIASDGNSELFLCSYEKELDFYSIYSLKDVRDKEEAHVQEEK